MPISRGLATLGPYQVLAELGAVPWGTAYVAVDGRSDTEVELLLVPESRWGADEGEVSWEGLLAETAALARIYHPGLPALVEITLLEGEMLIAVAAVPGPSLWEELRSGRWPDRARLVDWGCQLLEILGEAHRHGLLHRHLGEGEVRVGPGGELAIAGFGLTRRSFDPLGTTAPELAVGAAPTRRSDLYAVGVMLRRIARGARLTADDPLYWVLARATALDPAARFESAGQMAEALRRAGHGSGEAEERAAAPPPIPPAPAGEGAGDRRSALLFLAATVALLLTLLTSGGVWLAARAPQRTALPERATVGTVGATALHALQPRF